MDLFEKHWTTNEDIYSLYVSDRKPFYLLSHYDEKKDFWFFITTRVPDNRVQVVHPYNMFGLKHTTNTDYKFFLRESKFLEKLIRMGCNEIDVKPSNDRDPTHYYPDGDLLDWVKHIPNDQFYAWVKHLGNGK